MPIEIEIGHLEIAILFADGRFSEEHLCRAEPILERTVSAELEVLCCGDDFFDTERRGRGLVMA